MSRPGNIAQFFRLPNQDAKSAAVPRRDPHKVLVDPYYQALLALLDRVAPSDASIHVQGASGTFKELVARHVHRKSKRRGPFIAVKCGAVNADCAEREIFGREAGAVTEALTHRAGWFEAAHGGTLFLDDVGELPWALQGKLLRILQEGEVTRLGSKASFCIDARVISASNLDLAQVLKQGRFRSDLFHRLNMVPVRLGQRGAFRCTRHAPRSDLRSSHRNGPDSSPWSRP